MLLGIPRQSVEQQIWNFVATFGFGICRVVPKRFARHARKCRDLQRRSGRCKNSVCDNDGAGTHGAARNMESSHEGL